MTARSRAPMRPCPVSGCGRNRSTTYLMCRSDWWRVSPATRDEVYATFDTYNQAARSGNPEQFRKARDAYHAASAQAVTEAEESRRRALQKATER